MAISSHSTKNFRPDINGLRALAVTLVVLYHFGFSGISGGFVGVDVFFVISGYLMTQILSNGFDQPSFIRRFYFARIKRIVPALLVVSVVVLTLCWWMLEPKEYTQLAVHARDSLLFISNSTYAREGGYFDAAAHTKWLLHTWSLSIEWQFYLLIPLLFAVFKWVGISRQWQFLTFAAITVAIFINFGILTLGDQRNYFYSLKARSWELLLGGVVFFIATASPRLSKLRKTIEYFGLVLVIGSSVIFTRELFWPGWFAAVPAIGSAMILFAARSESIWLVNPISQWIGFRSYSIYLWHWPIVVFLSITNYISSLGAVVTGLAATLLLADISYRLIEEPGRRLFKRPLYAWASILVPWVCVLGAATVIIATNGIYSRFGMDARMLQTLEVARGDWGFPSPNKKNELITANVSATQDSALLTVVLGDSHAEQWFARVNNLAYRPAQVQFLTRGGCLPIPGYERFDNKGQCGNFGAEAWNKVLELRPQRLIISAAWPLYAGVAKGQSTATSCIKVENHCKLIESNVDLDFLFSQLEVKIQQAKKQGISVVVLGPIPFSKLSYVDEKARELTSKHLPLRLRRHSDSPDTAIGFIDENSFRDGIKPITDRLKRISKNSGAEYLDIGSMLCFAEKCPLVDSDGTPLYKDASHLRPSTVKSERFIWLDSALFGRQD